MKKLCENCKWCVLFNEYEESQTEIRCELTGKKTEFYQSCEKWKLLNIKGATK